MFYLFVRDWWLAATGWVAASADLRSVDLASGKSDTVLSGQSVTDYVISRDEKEVAFTTRDSSGASQIWLAPLDRRTPPRLIASAGDHVSFGRCRRVDLPVAGGEQRAGPDQNGRNGPRANNDRIVRDKCGVSPMANG